MNKAIVVTRPINDAERKALGKLHTALLACRDARIEIAPASMGVYVRSAEDLWYLEDSKGPTLESYDLAEYREDPKRPVQRYSATSQEAEPMFEDGDGEWVRFADIKDFLPQTIRRCRASTLKAQCGNSAAHGSSFCPWHSFLREPT